MILQANSKWKPLSEFQQEKKQYKEIIPGNQFEG